MRSARSYPLDSASIRPKQNRMRSQRPMRRRIRSCASAGPTIATLQRSNCNYHVTTIPDTKPQVCKPCSASADISSISSSTTDYAEKRCLDKDAVCNPLERIMHAKHKVIRRAREHMVKLIKSDHPAILQNDTVNSRMPKISTNTIEIQSHDSTKKLDNSLDFDVDRQRSICEKICRKDDTFERFGQNVSPVRDKEKYGSSGKISRTDRRLSETYPDDGRSSGDHFESNSTCEYRHSPCQLGRDGLSTIARNHSLINRQFTRKTNKFFVPYVNEDETDLSKTTFGDTQIYGRKLTLLKTDERVSELGTKSEQQECLGTRHELASITPKQRLEVPSARLSIKPSTTANSQPSVKTFYENPILKHPSGSSMLHAVAESTSDRILASRSTNTSPVTVTRQTQSTDTSHLEDSVGLRSHKVVEVGGKDASKESQNFPSPFYVIQPLLFVLAMFTVSMSGAYVGVMVASAACGTGSNMECEPSILQWLFSSRRHVRAF